MIREKIRPYFHMGWLTASIVSTLGVLVLTHIPQAAVPRIFQENLADKAEHILAYGLVSLLFLLSLKRSAPLSVPIVGLLALAGIGILDEVTQPLVNRYASVGDYMADLVGIGAAWVIFLVKRWLVFDTVAS